MRDDRSVVRARGARPGRRPRAATTRSAAARTPRRGGTFVGPDPGPHHALADALGVETFPTYNEGDNVYFADGERSDLQRHRARPAPRRPTRRSCRDLATVVAQLDEMAKEVPVDAPWKAATARPSGTRQTLDSWLNANSASPRFKSARAARPTRPIFGAEPRELSLLFTLFYIAASGNEQNAGHLRAQLQHARRRAGAPLRRRLAADPARMAQPARARG